MNSIKTPRLVLRQWREADLPKFHAINQCEHVTKYLPSQLSRDASDKLARKLQAHITEYGWGFWAVELRQTGEFIGFVGIAHFRGDTSFAPAIEIGWRLAYPHWGHGYATEAARYVLDFAFNVLQLDEVVSFTTIENKRSEQVMKKIGMQRDLQGDFMHPSLPLEHPLAPHILYRIRRQEMQH